MEIYVDEIAAAMERRGLVVRNLLESGQPGNLPDSILWWRRADGYGGIIHANAIEQLGIELTDLSTWAVTLTEAARPPGPETRWGAYVCFADEAAVWS